MPPNTEDDDFANRFAAVFGSPHPILAWADKQRDATAGVPAVPTPDFDAWRDAELAKLQAELGGLCEVQPC